MKPAQTKSSLSKFHSISILFQLHFNFIVPFSKVSCDVKETKSLLWIHMKSQGTIEHTRISWFFLLHTMRRISLHGFAIILCSFSYFYGSKTSHVSRTISSQIHSSFSFSWHHLSFAVFSFSLALLRRDFHGEDFYYRIYKDLEGSTRFWRI